MATIIAMAKEKVIMSVNTKTTENSQNNTISTRAGQLLQLTMLELSQIMMKGENRLPKKWPKEVESSGYLKMVGRIL